MASKPNTSLSIDIGKDESGKIVSIPLKTLVMHGLITGSTGTGKSRALQLITEKLYEQNVPVFLADIKGDVGGFAAPNDAGFAKERATSMKLDWQPKAYPVNYWSVGKKAIPFRIKLTDIDPILLARVFHLNQTQESHLRMIYLYAKEKQIPFVDLIDLENILEYIKNNKDEISGASTQSLDVILRQVKIAEGEGLNELFGMPGIALADIMGGINTLNLSEHRKRMDMPSLLMTFVMSKLFNELNDVGAVDKPRIVLFVDEAHYLFQDANPSLVNQIITILKQIRSKGVSVIFSTQNPEDIPDKILEQLGCKIVFALRAFTGDELKDIKGVADSFPPSKLNLVKEIPALEVGAAIVSPLDEKGKPMQPVKAMIAPPQSFMGVLSDGQLVAATSAQLRSKYLYAQILDRIDTDPGIRVKFTKPNAAAQERINQGYRISQGKTVAQSWRRVLMLAGAVIIAIILGLLFLIILGIIVMGVMK